MLLKEERRGKAKPLHHSVAHLHYAGISAHINHETNMTLARQPAAGPRLLSIARGKEEGGGKKTLIRRETNTPPPTPQSSRTDPKGRKQFQLRVAALLQVLMEMNGGGTARQANGSHSSHSPRTAFWVRRLRKNPRRIKTQLGRDIRRTLTFAFGGRGLM